MDIRWLNAVIDLPVAAFDQAGDFWAAVTNTSKGDIHPEHDEFVHLNPASGHMHLELQRIDSGPAGVHLDLMVDDIPGATDQAVAAGATVVTRPGHSVLKTPGGVQFCIVPAGSESRKAPAIDSGRPHAPDQICIDVPHDLFEADVAFWSRLTGWPANPAVLPEFRSFAQPAHLPLRILLQQLGADDTGGPRAHLDISAGEHRSAIVEAHVAQGATIRDAQDQWTALVSPGDLVYCITDRSPALD